MNLKQQTKKLLKGCRNEMSQTPDVLRCGIDKNISNKIIYCDSCYDKIKLFKHCLNLVNQETYKLKCSDKGCQVCILKNKILELDKLIEERL